MKNLKLNNLEQNQLSSQEMKNLNGGDWVCTCSCYWEGQGGSDSSSNSYANAQIPGGGRSKEGDNKYYREVKEIGN